MLKYSRQREAIKAYLSTRTDHPSADTVYQDIRQQFPNISLGTVYRNLNLLVRMGEAVRISDKSGSDRFDAQTKPHYHFFCLTCGTVEDVPMPSFSEVERAASGSIDADIMHHEINFFGVCSQCKHQQQRAQ